MAKKTRFYGAVEDWENLTPVMFVIEGKVTEKKVRKALNEFVNFDEDDSFEITVSDTEVCGYETDGDGEHDMRLQLEGVKEE